MYVAILRELMFQIFNIVTKKIKIFNNVSILILYLSNYQINFYNRFFAYVKIL